MWLRTVEHRLQLVDEHQTHTLPADADARTHLARVLGFRDRPGQSALEQLDTEQQRHQTIVRAIHEKLFFAPLLDTLAGVGALSMEAAQERLIAFGFRDVEQTRAALEELTAGLTRRSRVMQQLLPAILGWLSAAPDPDLGLLALRRLTEGYNRSSTLARRFRDSPIAAERTCRILGSSRVLGGALYRQPVVRRRARRRLERHQRGPDRRVHAERARRPKRSTPSTGGKTTPAGDRACAASSAGTSSGSARATCSASPTLDTAGRELSCLADACVEGRAALARADACRSP